MAVSVHYFHPKTLQLQTKFIACEHFKENHTADTIAEKLKSIFDRFGILEKVAYITTDSASNYIASLKYNGDNYRSLRMGYNWSDADDEPEPNASNNDDNVDDDDDDNDDDDDAGLEDIPMAMVYDPDAFVAHNVPISASLLGNMNHVKCAAHQLDKLGSKHALEAINKCSVYADIYNRIDAKLNKIWKIRDSRLQTECFVHLTGKHIIGPHRIRWMATYEAVSYTFIVKYVILMERVHCFFSCSFFLLKIERVLSIDREKLAKACEVLQLDLLESDEYEFLYEYQRIMKAIATALKSMEANKYTFGIYLPTLFGLRLKLSVLAKNAVHCLPLVEVIQAAFEKRFGNVLDVFAADGTSIPAYLAMVSNPNYKLNYIGLQTIPSNILNRVKQMLLNAANDILGDDSEPDMEGQPNDSLIHQTESNDDDGLLVFNNVNLGNDHYNCSTSEAKIKEEIDAYLRAKPEPDLIKGLKDFPVIRSIFSKFNCIRSSEAVCERMFSFADEILIMFFFCIYPFLVNGDS